MISAQAIQASIMAQASAFDLNGVAMPAIAISVGQAVALWSTSPAVVVTGVVTGTVGSGVVYGTLNIPPHPTAAQVFAGLGFNTLSGSNLATCVTQGVSMTLQGTPYASVSAGVGVGSDVSKIVVVNVGSLSALLVQFLPANFGQGAVLTGTQTQLATALSVLISQQFVLGYGEGAVVGPPSLVCGAGTSIGKLV